MSEVRICLAGELRSGKSTVAQYAVDKYGMVPFAFGDALKQEFHEQFPLLLREPKPRKGYQMFGQLMRYAWGEDIWINKCFAEISHIRKAAAAYNTTGSEVAFMPIITDARQPNEFEKCREENFVIIKIYTPEELRLERAKQDGDHFTLEDLQHETELHIKDLKANYVIVNDGSIEYLQEQFDDVMELITGIRK